MSLHPELIGEVPAATARVSRAAFPQIPCCEASRVDNCSHIPVLNAGSRLKSAMPRD